MSIPFDRLLFEVLICPESRKPLKYYNELLVSTDPDGRRAYPVENGMPLMLLDRSSVLEQAAWQTAMDEGVGIEDLPAESETNS